MISGARGRVAHFCERFGLRLPILEAPMAGACPPRRAAAVAGAGGMAGFGGVLSRPNAIAQWFADFRAAGGGPVQANLWVPDPPPLRDAVLEASVRDGLGAWGPPVPVEAGDALPPPFDRQCDAVIAARPTVASSIMGLFPPEMVAALKAAGIAWFATVTTVGEALAAEAAGADAVIAQGIEAGGHRGTFDAAAAARTGVGLFALLPALADQLGVPVIAAGGIADGRGIAAALTLGASAVQIGTALLVADEADTPPAWRARLADAAPEDSLVTPAFSGRPGRALPNAYLRSEPLAAPYPVQRALSAAMRLAAVARDDADAMQMWAGQSSARARAGAAADLLRGWWAEACHNLPPP